MDLDGLFDFDDRPKRRRHYGDEKRYDRGRRRPDEPMGDGEPMRDRGHASSNDSGGSEGARARMERAGNDHEYEHRRRRYDDDDSDMVMLPHLAKKALANPKLLIIGAIVLILVIIGALFLVLPLLGDLIDFVDKNGIQGTLDRVWKGDAPTTQ